jgi:hypothetical protein
MNSGNVTEPRLSKRSSRDRRRWWAVGCRWRCVHPGCRSWPLPYLARLGRCVMLRGRRRVGRSRLVERFAERSGAPFLFYAATGVSPRNDLARLARDAQASTLPMAGLVAAARPESWDAAFDVPAMALPADRASVLIIDEVPYLMGVRFPPARTSRSERRARGRARLGRCPRPRCTSSAGCRPRRTCAA